MNIYHYLKPRAKSNSNWTTASVLKGKPIKFAEKNVENHLCSAGIKCFLGQTVKMVVAVTFCQLLVLS